MEEQNLQMLELKHSLHVMAFTIVYHVLIRRNKMAVQSANIVILLKPDSL